MSRVSSDRLDGGSSQSESDEDTLYQLATPIISSGNSDHSEENDYESEDAEVQRRKEKPKCPVKHRRGKNGGHSRKVRKVKKSQEVSSAKLGVPGKVKTPPKRNTSPISSDNSEVAKERQSRNIFSQGQSEDDDDEVAAEDTNFPCLSRGVPENPDRSRGMERLFRARRSDGPKESLTVRTALSPRRSRSVGIDLGRGGRQQ